MASRSKLPLFTSLSVMMGEIVTTVEGHSYGKEKVEEVIALLTKTE